MHFWRNSLPVDLLTPPWQLCFHLCPSVGWFVCLVCQNDYTKTTQRISTKLGWRMGLGPEQTPVAVGTDPGNVFVTVFNIVIKVIFDILVNFSGNNRQILMTKVRRIEVVGVYEWAVEWAYSTRCHYSNVTVI